MSSTTPLATSVPNEGTIMESLDSDQIISKNRRFSVAPIIPPILLITTVSLGLGLAPYFRLRHHILRQGGVMQAIRTDIANGNQRFMEHVRTRDVEVAARQLDNQRAQMEFELKLQALDRRNQELEAISRTQIRGLRVMRRELDRSNERAQELEKVLGDVTGPLGNTLGQVAAFIEETQLKDGERDRYGVDRIRELAMRLQNTHKSGNTSRTNDENTESTSAER